MFAELAGELGGIDRVIVNAGVGKGAPLGSGKLWANKATIETNLVAALVQIETALEMFKKSGSGHLVLISSVLGNKGVAGVKAAYAASKAGVSSLGESLRAEYASGPIKVTVIEPGYIESEMTAKSESTMLMVDNETGYAKWSTPSSARPAGRSSQGGRGFRWWPCSGAPPPRFTNRSPERRSNVRIAVTQATRVLAFANERKGRTIGGRRGGFRRLQRRCRRHRGRSRPCLYPRAVPVVPR